MSARILAGREIARRIETELAGRVEALARRGRRPALAVILVGAGAPARAYGRMIAAGCQRCGVRREMHELPADLEPAEAFALVDRLNADPAIQGVILKRPLPGRLGDEALLQALDPAKDVDGCHFQNLGRLVVWGAPAGRIPCTPAGVLEILRRSGIEPRGRHAVILGRSVTVGKPLANLLYQKDPWADATVTLCHSGTEGLEEHTRRADLLVAAVGVPEFVRAEMVKPGAVVVDVGTNTVPDRQSPRGYRLVGDVHFSRVKEVAGALTPVPGGVGPVTTAMLLKNLVEAAERSAAEDRDGGELPPPRGFPL